MCTKLSRPLALTFLLAATLLLTIRLSAKAAIPATGPSAGSVDDLLPTAIKPVVVPKTDQADRDRWRTAIDNYMSLPPDQVTAHPAADFPGAVQANVPRVKRTFSFARNLPRWQSTGLYAPPGAVVTVHVSSADAKAGLAVVVGCHTDSLIDLEKWYRFPRISRRFAIKQSTTTVANAFGGLIYIDVQRDPALGGHHLDTYGGYGWLGEEPAKVPGTFEVEIDGAIDAPLYRAGKTTEADWKSMQKSAAPWGELASDRLILTVRTSALAKIEDPAALMAFWDKVIDTEAELAGWPGQPAPPERIVVDRDISAGWMHSGYPIMAHLQSEADFTNLPKLKTKGDWGAFHELGHNHEGVAYTFGGDFVEVDVNLYSMYVMKQIVGLEMNSRTDLRDIDGLLRQRLGADGKVTPWTNLAIFCKTIEAFGWGPLHETLKSYAVPGGADGIKTRQDKIDQWVLRYSKATGRDLSGYYAAFGLNCGDEVQKQLHDLPGWTPANIVPIKPNGH